jgi:hypothetical protein
MSILDNFLEIESDETLYQYTFTYKNTLMYPFIRYVLLQSAKENILAMPNAYDSIRFGIIHKIKYLIKSFWYRPPKHLQSDIVFFGSDVSNIRQKNVYFNRLTEFFANEYPSKTILIESADKKDYKRPRTYPKVFTTDFMKILVKFKSAKKSIDLKDSSQIHAFVDYLKQHLNHELKDSEVWEDIKQMLFFYSKNLPYLFQEYTKLLKQLSSKLVFLEDACYGADKTPLIMAAKELDIPVGEYQHGMVSLDHPAYNYSDQLLDSYKHYMPDFFVSYGNYWTKNSRIPIKILELGNPILSETTSKVKNEIKKNQILYTSSVVYPERDTQEIILLNKIMKDKGYSVIFRIHPSETPRLQTVYRPIVDAKIQIDTQPLYETLKETKYIVANTSTGNASVENISTVLFEATIFNCVVFAVDPSIDKKDTAASPFNYVQSVDEIADFIIFKKYKKTDSTIFWEDGWRTKYHQLVAQYLS